MRCVRSGRYVKPPKHRDHALIQLLAWLKEKLASDRAVLRGLYQPLSFIPKDIWKSGPSSTNVKESTQGRDILSGKDKNLVSGILDARFDDTIEMESVDILQTTGIDRRYVESTVSKRVLQAAQRNMRKGKRKVDQADIDIQVNGATIPVYADSYRHGAAALLLTQDPAQQAKKSKAFDKALDQFVTALDRQARLEKKGSGRVRYDATANKENAPPVLAYALSVPMQKSRFPTSEVLPKVSECQVTLHSTRFRSLRELWTIS